MVLSEYARELSWKREGKMHKTMGGGGGAVFEPILVAHRNVQLDEKSTQKRRKWRSVAV